MEDNNAPEQENLQAYYKPSLVLISIDTHPTMFVKYKNEETGEDSCPFKDCLRVCYEMANSLLFVQNKRAFNPFAIVLAIDDDMANLVGFDDNPIDSIKLLKQTQGLSVDKLRDTYQRKGDFSLSGFFMLCKKKFREVNVAVYKRIMVYVTNEDNPPQDDTNKKFTALNEIKTFNELDIEFQMVTMNPNFDYSLFYNELFSLMKTPCEEVLIEDTDGLYEKLSSLVLLRYQKRNLCFFPFQGNQSKFLKVVQKTPIQPARLYNNSYVAKDGTAVKSVRVARTEQMLRTYKLKLTDGESIEFDVQERNNVKTNDLPIGFTLICVSNRITDVGLTLKAASILEADPKEELVNYFDQFWQYCVNKNKVLMCAKKLRFEDKLRYAELIPKYVNKTRVFIVKYIPFGNEISYPPSDLQKSGSPRQIHNLDEKTAVTNEIIEKLSYDYNPKMFSNPTYVKKTAFLRSKLLDEPLEEVEDPTANTAGIDRNLGNLADRFNRVFNLEESDASAGKKRKAPAAPKFVKGKKAK